jgi:hypothetical protein
MVSTKEYDQTACDMRQPGTERADGKLDARELIRHATLAASSHNTQPWKFRIRNDSITILPDFSRRCRAVDPEDSHLFRSLGCAAENLVHAAAAQGFLADMRFDAKENAIHVSLKRDVSAAVTDLYRAIPERQCVKTAYDGTTIGAPELQKLKIASVGPSIRTIMLLSNEQKEAVIEFVTRGDVAQLTDKAFRNELVSWIRFNPAEAMQKRDGLAGRTSGQPALPRWLAKFIIGFVLTPKGQAATDAANIRTSSGLAVFVSAEQSRDAWIQAGRVYERFALQATALGICTAFINQPIEVPQLRSQFESWLKLDGEYAQLMIRFGHGPSAPFSLRRPIDDVIIRD